MDYIKAYALLLGTMSDALTKLKSHIISQEIENAMRILRQGLEKAEEMYIYSEE